MHAGVRFAGWILTVAIAMPTAGAGRGWVCDADVNIDAKVDVLDLLAVLGDWNTCGGGLGSGGPGTDVNGDSTVDVLDLLLVLKGWGEDCSPPEVTITPVAHVGDPVPGMDGRVVLVSPAAVGAMEGRTDYRIDLWVLACATRALM